MGSEELTDWIKNELNGYGAESELPEYRSSDAQPIQLRFVAYIGSASVERNISSAELPQQLRPTTLALGLREPVAELVSLSEGETDPGLMLPNLWIARYRQLASEQKVPSMDMMILDGATIMYPRTRLKGALDRVRTAALNLTLELEDVSTEIGSTEGPKVADSALLAQTLNIFHTQVYGEKSKVSQNIATGEGARAVQTSPRDVDSLLEAAAQYLGKEGVEALAEAINKDGGAVGERTIGVLGRVKHGSYDLAAGVTSSGAYEGLVALIQHFTGTG